VSIAEAVDFLLLQEGLSWEETPAGVLRIR
jgi:hypothetical protein